LAYENHGKKQRRQGLAMPKKKKKKKKEKKSRSGNHLIKQWPGEGIQHHLTSSYSVRKSQTEWQEGELVGRLH